MEPLINTRQSDATQFGHVSPTAWRISGKTMTIDEYIENQRQSVNSSDLRVLGKFTGRLLDKLKESNAGAHPGTQRSGVLDSPGVGITVGPADEGSVADLDGGGWLCRRLLAETI